MALHSTDNEASNQEKAKTKSNQDDKCMIDKLKTISNTTKSGSNNFASTGNRSFATFLSKIPKENNRNHFQENFREIEFTENIIFDNYIDNLPSSIIDWPPLPDSLLLEAIMGDMTGNWS